MKLHEIISTLETPTNSVLIESMLPYKKSLCTYYLRFFCCDPVLMVTSVSNACQYAQIVPSNDLNEAIYHWVDSMNLETEEERENEIELILFQSIMLNNL